MKTKTNSFPGNLFFALFGSLLLFSGSAFAEGHPVFSYHHAYTGGDPVKEKPVKRKDLEKIESRKKSAVKIYKDISRQNLHLYAKKSDRKQISFFMFDLEGTLVQNYKMNAKDHKKITGMKKGTYIYRVFCGDEETAAGKIEIK